MMEILDTVDAYTLEPGDVVQHTNRHGSHILEIKDVVDLGKKVEITAYSHDTGDIVTKQFDFNHPFDIMGA